MQQGTSRKPVAAYTRPVVRPTVPTLMEARTPVICCHTWGTEGALLSLPEQPREICPVWMLPVNTLAEMVCGGILRCPGASYVDE